MANEFEFVVSESEAAAKRRQSGSSYVIGFELTPVEIFEIVVSESDPIDYLPPSSRRAGTTNHINCCLVSIKSYKNQQSYWMLCTTQC